MITSQESGASRIGSFCLGWPLSFTSSFRNPGLPRSRGKPRASTRAAWWTSTRAEEALTSGALQCERLPRPRQESNNARWPFSNHHSDHIGYDKTGGRIWHYTASHPNEKCQKWDDTGEQPGLSLRRRHKTGL